jgi:hypothetical protein
VSHDLYRTPSNNALAVEARASFMSVKPKDVAGAPPVDLSADVFMGHEFAAEVLELGPDTIGPSAGTIVTSIPILLTELLFPARQADVWLGKLGLTVAGLVYLAGVTFMTLEDETGFVNLVLWKRVFEAWMPWKFSGDILHVFRHNLPV